MALCDGLKQGGHRGRVCDITYDGIDRAFAKRGSLIKAFLVARGGNDMKASGGK